MKIIAKPGLEPLQTLVPRFLTDENTNLLAEDASGWVVEISHHISTDTNLSVAGDWVSVTLSVGVREEIVLSSGEPLLNGLILQSHITSLENILQCLQLDLHTRGWQLMTYEEGDQ